MDDITKGFKSNVYVCCNEGCNHIWRTPAKTPRCVKCGSDSPRLATAEEKKQFNSKAFKPKTESQQTEQPAQQEAQQPAPQEARQPEKQPEQKTAKAEEKGALDFLIPSNLRPELKAVNVESIINAAPAANNLPAVNPENKPAEQPKKRFNLNSKGLFMMAGLSGIAAAIFYMLKKKKQQADIKAYMEYQEELNENEQPEQVIFNPAGFT